MKKLEDYVVSIPDFPEPGIIFRDITSILQDPDGFKLAIDSLLAMVKDVDFDGCRRGVQRIYFWNTGRV